MTITSPSGRTYNWDKPEPPTQADIDALKAYDDSLSTPSLSKKGVMEQAGELAGDIAVEGGTSLAGQALGAATGPGYFAIAPAAGAYGNYLKQQRELERGDRKDLSYGEMLASALINLVPASSMAKTGTTVARTVGMRAATGAAIGAGSKAVEIGVDEGRFPSLNDTDRILAGAAGGGIVGGGVGAGEELAKALSPAAKRLWGRLAGKTHGEVAQALETVKAEGTDAQREAAGQVMDEVGRRLGLIKEGVKSAEESAAVMGAIPTKSAKEAAQSLKRAPYTEEEIAARRAASKVDVAGPKSAQESAAVMGAVPVKSARESASVLAQQTSPAQQSALVFQKAIDEGQSPAAANALKNRFLAEQAQAQSNVLAEQARAQSNSLRAQDFLKARAEEAAQSIKSGQLSGEESVIMAGSPESTQLNILDTRPGMAQRERARLRAKLGIQEEVLPTSEDVVSEFSSMRGIGSRAKAKEMGLEGGYVDPKLAAGLGIGAAGVGGAAALAGSGKTKPQSDQFIEVEVPGLPPIKYNLKEMTEEQIVRDVQKKQTEAATIQVSQPYLDLKSRWANTESASDRLAMMRDWVLSRRGGEIAARAGIQGVGSYAGPAGRAISGGAAEYVGNLIGQRPTTIGGVASGAIEALPGGRMGDFGGNLLKFAGASMAGEVAKSAIDKNELPTLRELGEAASRGGLGAVGKQLAEMGAPIRSQRDALSRDASKIVMIKDAADKGIILDPFDLYKTPSRKAMVEVAGGTPDFQKQASIVNVPLVEDMVRRQAGGQSSSDLTPQFFAARRLQEGEAYRSASAVSSKAQQLVEEWKDLNDKARSAYKKLANNWSNELRQEARSYTDAANAAFNSLEMEISSKGNKQLAQDLQRSRVKIAELHAIESGIRVGDGKLDDARVWSAMLQDGVPLKGDLALIAKIAESQPGVFSTSVSLRPMTPSSMATTPVRAPVMNYLLSQTGQRQLNQGPYYDPTFASTLARFGGQEVGRAIPYR